MNESKKQAVEKQIDGPSMPTRRLVLGFDAGCTMCSDLAQRIEERVGDKLEVRSLHDPQMEHWRTQTLGENAPWAPTLVEVGGKKVKAWTGIGLGLRLSRSIGPLATWQIMQILGELVTSVSDTANTPFSKAAVGMSRGQFLKGVGGAAIALSVLHTTAALSHPASVRAPSSGTLAQRREVEKIVRLSRQYRNLVRNFGKPFDFERARFTVSDSEGLASVIVPTATAPGIAILAHFFVSTQTKSVYHHRHVVFVPARGASQAVFDAEEVKVTAYSDDEVVDGVTASEGSVVTSDGRRMSLRQFESEAEDRQNEAEARESVEEEPTRTASGCRPGYGRCERNRFNFCYYSTLTFCQYVRYFHWTGLIACWLYPSKRSGCRSLAVRSCYIDYCT